MRKFFLLSVLLFIMSSCVVSTAGKVVKTAGKVAVGTVKTAVKGVSWTVQKANGKINEDRLNGKWKVVGIYKGSFDEFSAQENPENLFSCSNGEEVYEFKMKKERMFHSPCGSDEKEKYKIKYSFEKNKDTKEKENMITYGPSYFTIINVTGKHLALEGYFLGENGSKVKSVCLLDQI